MKVACCRRLPSDSTIHHLKLQMLCFCVSICLKSPSSCVSRTPSFCWLADKFLSSSHLRDGYPAFCLLTAQGKALHPRLLAIAHQLHLSTVISSLLSNSFGCHGYFVGHHSHRACSSKMISLFLVLFLHMFFAFPAVNRLHVQEHAHNTLQRNDMLD